MRSLLLVQILSIAAIAISCKTADRTRWSQLKGIGDVDRTETSDDGKVWVWCKKNRSHFGQCKFTMGEEQFESNVSRLCEDDPVAPCARGGNSDHERPGGEQADPAPLPGLDVDACGEVPEALAGITVAFSGSFFEEFDAKFDDLPPAIRLQTRKSSFCGVVGKLAATIGASDSLAEFVRGGAEESAAAKVLIIDGRSANVDYRAAQNILRLPAKFDRESKRAIETALESHGIRICSGKTLQGQCIFLGALGKSCTQVCTDEGLPTHDVFTAEIGNSESMCRKAAEILGETFVGVGRNNHTAVRAGCRMHSNGSLQFGMSKPDHASQDYRRICACK